MPLPLPGEPGREGVDWVVEQPLSMVDQVIPKLAEHWWNIMEKEYFSEFSKKEPSVFSTICDKAYAAVVSVDFTNGYLDDAASARPFSIVKAVAHSSELSKGATSEFLRPVERWDCGAQRILVG